jgi:MarR family transcriptional regulator, 2-MHQ and catechol-resistance regulon repressor
MQLKAVKAKAKPDARDESEALYEALSDLVRVYQFRDRDTICCHDVSVTQCYALEAVVLHGPMRLNALAERLLLDKSTASRVVDALERKGYLARLADPADARATLLRATANGQKLHDRIRADLISEHEATIADLSPDARRAAIEVITRLARAAEKRFACGPSTGCAPMCGTKTK